MTRSAPEAPPIAARRAAMNLLARREHSFHELLQKLTDKFPDFSREEILLPALQRLQTENLQSDARFTEAYVRYRSSRGFGPLKISAELHPRKIDRELLKTALYEKGPDWEALCAEALHGKFQVRSKPSADERMRWQRFLQQRGFEQEQIRAAFKSAQSALEDDL